MKKTLGIALAVTAVLLGMFILGPGILDALNRTMAYSADSSGTAQWDVDTQFDSKAVLEAVSGTEDTIYSLTVTNDSETAGSIDLTFTGLPDGIQVTVKDGETVKGTAAFANDTAVVRNVAALGPRNGDAIELTVCFAVPRTVPVGEYALAVQVSHTQID